MDWFLYDIGLRHERVKSEKELPFLLCYQERSNNANIIFSLLVYDFKVSIIENSK